MVGNRSLKRRTVLSLHRWLIRLRLLNDPRRNRAPTDAPLSEELGQTTMQGVSRLTIERPETVTVEDSSRILKDRPGQATIEEPDCVIIGSDPAVVIDHPATVTIQDQKLVVIEDPDEQPRMMVPIDAADGSGSIVFQRPSTISSTDIERVTVE